MAAGKPLSATARFSPCRVPFQDKRGRSAGEILLPRECPPIVSHPCPDVLWRFPSGNCR